MSPYFENPAPMTNFASFDIASVVAGFREFGADMAWIQLLQYIGSSEGVNYTKEQSMLIEMISAKNIFGLKLISDSAMSGIKAAMPDLTGDAQKYKDLYKYTLRVVRLNPRFRYAYLFSAGALAWNYERPDEAMELLKEGIKNNPDYWQFHLYVSAILYKKHLMHKEMLAMLEKAIKQKDAPNMVKSIVANLYEKEKRPADALKIWLDIAESKDPMYYEKSLGKIEKLSAALGLISPKRED